LRVLVQSASRVSVVNDVSLEDYLAGVVPVEMPSTWPAAALQAQAVAARSYAARRLRPTVSWFDVPDDSTSQIYRGVVGEQPPATAAIAATAGLVLRSGSTIANAPFHSTGGGATESNENVYTSTSGKRIARPVGYLRGSSDRAADGTPFDARAPYATWTSRTYTRAELSAWFAADSRTNVGDLVALDLRDRGVSGRLVSVTLIGSAGSRTVSGEIFRSVFNAHKPSTDPSLKSTLLDTAPIP
jgi:stage II sporulation protein D